MALEIKINPKLFDRAVEEGRVSGKLEVAAKAGLSYPTVMQLTTGKHGKTTYKVLAAYLVALGINPYDLANMKFNEIFSMRE